MHIEKLPRFPLAQLLTPLEFLPRVFRKLGGPKLLIKRDDQTGLALGGNKTRKLEFLVGQALEQGRIRSSLWVRRSRIVAGKRRRRRPRLD